MPCYCFFGRAIIHTVPWLAIGSRTSRWGRLGGFSQTASAVVVVAAEYSLFVPLP